MKVSQHQDLTSRPAPSPIGAIRERVPAFSEAGFHGGQPATGSPFLSPVLFWECAMFDLVHWRCGFGLAGNLGMIFLVCASAAADEQPAASRTYLGTLDGA